MSIPIISGELSSVRSKERCDTRPFISCMDSIHEYRIGKEEENSCPHPREYTWRAGSNCNFRPKVSDINAADWILPVDFGDPSSRMGFGSRNEPEDPNTENPGGSGVYDYWVMSLCHCVSPPFGHVYLLPYLPVSPQVPCLLSNHHIDESSYIHCSDILRNLSSVAPWRRTVLGILLSLNDD